MKQFGRCCCPPGAQWFKVATILYPYRRFTEWWQLDNPYATDPNVYPEITVLPNEISCARGYRKFTVRVVIKNIELNYQCSEAPGVFYQVYSDGDDWAEYTVTLDKYDSANDTESTTKGYTGAVNLYDNCNDPEAEGPPFRLDGTRASEYLNYAPMVAPLGYDQVDSYSLTPTSIAVRWSKLNPDGVTRETLDFSLSLSERWDYDDASNDMRDQLRTLEIVGANLYTVVTECSAPATEQMWFAAPNENTGSGDGRTRILRLVKYYDPALGWTQYEEDLATVPNPPNACPDPYGDTLWKTIYEPGDNWITTPILKYDDELAAARLRTGYTTEVAYSTQYAGNTLMLARRSRGYFPSGIDCIRRHLFENRNDDAGTVPVGEPSVPYCAPYWQQSDCVETSVSAGTWTFDPWRNTDIPQKVIGDVENGRIWISYPEDRGSPSVDDCCEFDEPTT